MKKLIKRIVPILLSVFMLFGVLDTPVSTDCLQSDPEIFLWVFLCVLLKENSWIKIFSHVSCKQSAVI